MVPIEDFHFQLVVHVFFHDETKNDLVFSLDEQESAINTFRDFLHNPQVFYVEIRTRVTLPKPEI